MAKAKSPSETPLMKQYNAIKAKYPGALLLFRVGDFYETFGEDAIKASKVLDIVLTKRANGAASHIELAGFPHHSLDSYLPKLVRAGNRVAICDQLEDPKSVKGIVKRGVTELVTPGLSYNDNVLEQKSNNYLCSLFFGKDTVGVAFLDLSTGEFLAAEGSPNYIDKLIQGLNPSEFIFSKAQRNAFEQHFRDNFNTYHIDDWVYAYDFAYEKLTNHFSTSSLKGFGVEDMKLAIVAAGGVLHYLEDTEHKELDHISTISRLEEDKYVWLDKFTIRNLELIHPQHQGGVPLREVLDHTLTPMGSRLMKRWMVLPLKELNRIEDRLSVVDAFYENPELRDQVAEHLEQINDLERLISKVAVGRINPKELLQLRRSLENIGPVKAYLANTNVKALAHLADQLDTCEKLVERINTELKDDAPMHANQGGIIKEGVDEELDELRGIAFSGKDYLIQIQQREIKNTERRGVKDFGS